MKTACGRRHVKKTCRWHVFSVDPGSYAAVASILVCPAPSFSPDLSGYAAVASILILKALSYAERAGQSPAPTHDNRRPAALFARRDVGIAPYGVLSVLCVGRPALTPPRIYNHAAFGGIPQHFTFLSSLLSGGPNGGSVWPSLCLPRKTSAFLLSRLVLYCYL